MRPTTESMPWSPTFAAAATVFGGADGAYVWVAEQGRAARREVRLVKRLAGAILIEGELAEGEPVVMEGVQSVRAGVALKPLSDNLNPTGNG